MRGDESSFGDNLIAAVAFGGSLLTVVFAIVWICTEADGATPAFPPIERHPTLARAQPAETTSATRFGGMP